MATLTVLANLSRFLNSWIWRPLCKAAWKVLRAIFFVIRMPYFVLKFLFWDMLCPEEGGMIGKYIAVFGLIGFCVLCGFGIRESSRAKAEEEARKEAKKQEELRVKAEKERNQAWLLADITNRLERIENQLKLKGEKQ